MTYQKNKNESYLLNNESITGIKVDGLGEYPDFVLMLDEGGQK